jgi:hypothetical protein
MGGATPAAGVAHVATAGTITSQVVECLAHRWHAGRMLDTPGNEVAGSRAGRVPRITQQTWPRWAFTYLYVFRAVVVGSSLVLAALGWLTHTQWLLMASICIAAGEFIETSYYIAVLNWAQNTGRLSRRI